MCPKVPKFKEHIQRRKDNFFHTCTVMAVSPCCMLRCLFVSCYCKFRTGDLVRDGVRVWNSRSHGYMVTFRHIPIVKVGLLSGDPDLSCLLTVRTASYSFWSQMQLTCSALRDRAPLCYCFVCIESGLHPFCSLSVTAFVRGQKGLHLSVVKNCHIRVPLHRVQ